MSGSDLDRRVETALLAWTSDADRVRSYYGPVAEWMQQVVLHPLQDGVGPCIIGINGPQGAGKSTLADAMVHGLGAAGLEGIAISIDDFYLTHHEQLALAARRPGNRLLAYRGYPGTHHDVALGERTLIGLRDRRPTEVPAYDKSAHGGRGDRADRASFREIDGPLDFLILEGWMLGFRPLDAAQITDPELQPPNEMLADYARWDRLLSAMVRLDPPTLQAIVHWRIDAERARRAQGHPALSEQEARDYIERFLPAYRSYLPGLRAHPPTERVLAVGLDESRRGTVTTG